MSFGKKLLGAFVEEIPDNNEDDVGYVYESTYDLEEDDVDVSGVDVEDIIGDIYAQNDLVSDPNIFKVEELSNNLPKEMATDTKRKTVQGILTSFGVTIDDIVDDGEKRRNVLDVAMSKLVKESSDKVDSTENEIESYKVKISELEKVIADEKDKIKVCTEKISAEVDRVSNLIEFIGGK